MTRKADNYNLSNTETSKSIVDAFKEFFIFAIVCAIPAVVLHLDARLLPEFRSEVSITENLQLILIAYVIGLFVQVARQVPDLKRAAILIAGFFVVVFIRENDNHLDNVYHGFWFPLAMVVTLASIVYFSLDYKNAFKQFAIVVQAPYMRLLIFALALLLVFSRLFGMGKLWRAVMQDNFMYSVKSMIEEGTELLAYTLICYAAFKVNRYLIKQYRKPN